MSQNAGHSPEPAGSLMRASTRPCPAVRLPSVVMRAEVYRHGPYQQVRPLTLSDRAVIARWPEPSSETFSGRRVEYSSCSLPQPPPWVS